MQCVDNAGPVPCQFTESMDTVVFVNEQRMLRSDGKNAQADLDPDCLHIT